MFEIQNLPCISFYLFNNFQGGKSSIYWLYNIYVYYIFQYPDFEWDSATQGLVLARWKRISNQILDIKSLGQVDEKEYFPLSPNNS